LVLISDATGRIYYSRFSRGDTFNAMRSRFWEELLTRHWIRFRNCAAPRFQNNNFRDYTGITEVLEMSAYRRGLTALTHLPGRSCTSDVPLVPI